jgi:TRAP-type C4-dicarboxylate transport system substrate-binding protein
MRKKNGIMISCVALVFGLLFLSASVPLQAADVKEIKLRFSSFFPPVHPISKLNEEWCKEVEKRTDGRVKVSFFPGNTLTPPNQTYDSVVKGIADMGQSLMAYSPGRFPLTEVLTQPLGYTTGYQATKLANAYYKKFQPKEFDDTKVMYFHGHPPGVLHTRKVISSIDEVKGLRIKVNAEIADVITAIGGAPVTMPITETYDAVQKGLLDGLLLPIEALKGWRFAEVIKCSIENSAVAYTAGMFVVMNKAKFDSLPQDIQQIIEKLNEEWIEKQGKLWDTLNQEARDFAIEKGVKIIQSSKEEEAATREKMKPVLDNYVKAVKAKGLPGEEALQFCLDYIKTNP